MGFSLLRNDSSVAPLNSHDVDGFPLYKSDLESCKKSLSFALNFNSYQTQDKIIFHTYWREINPFGRKQAAVIKSIVASHKGSGKNVEINLWSNKPFEDNSFYREISKYVNFKIWNLDAEVKGTLLEGTHITKEYIEDGLCYLEGDIFRLLTLHKYGGFYVDMDVLVLREFSPLNSLEFVYQWGTGGNKGEVFKSNGAVMRMNAGSPLSFEFMELLLSTPATHNTTGWGCDIYHKTPSQFLSLPGVWFDPDWGFDISPYKCCRPSFEDSEIMEFFHGSFAWHWHNMWTTEPHPNSKFSVLERSFEDQLKL